MSAVLFAVLFLLVLWADVDVAAALGLPFEEEVLLPALAALFLGGGFLVLNRVVAGSSRALAELAAMTPACKALAVAAFVFIAAASVMALFKALGLAPSSPRATLEEEAVAAGMLASVSLFLFFYARALKGA